MFQLQFSLNEFGIGLRIRFEAAGELLRNLQSLCVFPQAISNTRSPKKYAGFFAIGKCVFEGCPCWPRPVEKKVGLRQRRPFNSGSVRALVLLVRDSGLFENRGSVGR